MVQAVRRLFGTDHAFVPLAHPFHGRYVVDSAPYGDGDFRRACQQLADTIENPNCYAFGQSRRRDNGQEMPIVEPDGDAAARFTGIACDRVGDGHHHAAAYRVGQGIADGIVRTPVRRREEHFCAFRKAVAIAHMSGTKDPPLCVADDVATISRGQAGENLESRVAAARTGIREVRLSCCGSQQRFGDTEEALRVGGGKAGKAACQGCAIL
jgi:hypothetical protein